VILSTLYQQRVGLVIIAWLPHQGGKAIASI
jgi:hypothetical protein